MNTLRLIWSTVAILAIGLAAQPAQAQTIRGTLVDRTTGNPIRGGFVVLIKDSTQELGRALTDLRGEFFLRLEEAGRYRLKSAVIGIRTELSGPIDVGPDEVVDYRFEISATVISLDKIVVTGERTCKTSRPTGLAASTLWDEAQKALNAVEWTQNQGTLRHRLVQYRRELDPQSLEIREQEFSSEEGVFNGSPFLAATAAELAKKGFIQRTDKNGYYYYAPDAGVLLSDEFADLHCFSVTEDVPEEPGLLGLQFEPVAGRKRSDIKGVLWLDQKTAELRFLEYKYNWLPWDIDDSHIGGRVEFEHLPTGTWIVRRWWIRMPDVRYRQATIYRGADPYLLSIREIGGWVNRIQTAGGETVNLGRATLEGVLTGSVSDSASKATIILLGPDYTETHTDKNGRFSFRYLTPGAYGVTVAAERTPEFLPPPGELMLSADQQVTISLTIPRASARRSLICPETDTLSATGVISGLVRDAVTRRPLGDARIAFSGNRMVAASSGELRRETVHVETISDWTGYYRICNVPSGVTLDLDVTLSGWEAPNLGTRLSPGSMSRLDILLTAADPPRGN
ncbi:MAG: carboxypeptidase regulatory-like domain-containing protein [Gemmatimonadales bacterium]